MNRSIGSEMEARRAGGITPEFFDRILAQIETLPEMRTDRIAEAKSHLASEGPTAHDVASKIVDRMISDSLR